MTRKPIVLFVCVHNAGRSQMAAGYMTALSQGKVEVLSAGSAPKDWDAETRAHSFRESATKTGFWMTQLDKKSRPFAS